MIDHTLYTSNFATRKTTGIDVRTHRKVFELDDAGYTPIVSDGRRLYLIGHYTFDGLRPVGR